MTRIVVDPGDLSAMASLLADAAVACEEVRATVAAALDGVDGTGSPAVGALVSEAASSLGGVAQVYRSEAAGLDARCRCCAQDADGGVPGLWALAADSWGAAPGAVGTGVTGPDPQAVESLRRALEAALPGLLAAPAVGTVIVGGGPIAAFEGLGQPAGGNVVVGGGPIAEFAGLGQPAGGLINVDVGNTALLNGVPGALAIESPLGSGTPQEIISAGLGIPVGGTAAAPAANVTNNLWDGLQDPLALGREGTLLTGLGDWSLF